MNIYWEVPLNSTELLPVKYSQFSLYVNLLSARDRIATYLSLSTTLSLNSVNTVPVQAGWRWGSVQILAGAIGCRRKWRETAAYANRRQHGCHAGGRKRHLYCIQPMGEGIVEIASANYTRFLESCMDWVNFPRQMGIGIGPQRIVRHICVHFQTCRTILGTISKTLAEPSQPWQWWEGDNERSIGRLSEGCSG